MTDLEHYRALPQDEREILGYARWRELETISTHGPNCYSFGARHYHCALEEIARLRALALAEVKYSRHPDGAELAALSAAIRAGVGAVPAPPDVVAELEEVKTVCAQAYQVMGVLLSEAGRLDSPEAKKILDNLAEQRLRHTDVLPWAAQAARVFT